MYFPERKFRSTWQDLRYNPAKPFRLSFYEIMLIELFSVDILIVIIYHPNKIKNIKKEFYVLLNIEGSLYTHTGVSYPDGALSDPSAYSATSLASASLLYSSWFAQTKPSQLFGLQGKRASLRWCDLLSIRPASVVK